MNYLIEYRTGMFSLEGIYISYRQVTPPYTESTKFPGILFLHGASAPSQKGKDLFFTFQEKLAEEGFCSFAYDTQGVGESRGNFSDSTLAYRLREAEEAYKVFSGERLADAKRMYLIGVGMGGQVAANLAGKHPEWFRALVLINSTLEVNNYTGEVLLLRSENDQVIPEAITDRYIQAGNGKIIRRTIPNAPHTVFSAEDKVCETARRFIYSQTINFFKST